MAFNEGDSRRKAWRLIAEKHKREAEARPHGPFTQNPEPPGADWDSVIHHEADFAAAGLCELWRLDWGDETRFGCMTDFPPDFNWSGMWWRLAS